MRNSQTIHCFRAHNLPHCVMGTIAKLLLCVVLMFVPLSFAFSQSAPWEPYLIKDINQFDLDDNARHFTIVGDVIMYVSDSSDYGLELWRSDGTAHGTRLVKDITPGPRSTSFHSTEFVNVNGTLFFTADDGVSGPELWKSDGSEEGTGLVKDLVPGEGSGVFPRDLVGMNGVLYFSHGIELWRSDGTEEGTWPLCTGYYTTTPTCGGAQHLANIDGTLFFTARSNTLFSALELWKTDGTIAGTQLVKDIYPGDCGRDFCSSGPSRATEHQGIAYFVAKDESHGYALWRSDGTESGTYLVKDVDPQNNSVFSDGTAITQMTRNGDHIFFVVDHSTLWKSDGTPAGTVSVREFSRYAIRYLTSINGKLWFSGDDGVHGHEPWTSDGTLDGTSMLRDVNSIPDWTPGTTRASYPDWFLGVSGYVFFPGPDDELWVTDGTADQTRSVGPELRIRSLLGRDNDYAPVSLENTLYFANAGIPGKTLGGFWKYDLDSQIASIVKNTNIGNGGTSVRASISLNDKVYFTLADNFEFEPEPHSLAFWESDGSPGNARLIKANFTDENGNLLEGLRIDRFFDFDGILAILTAPSFGGDRVYLFDETSSQVELLIELPTLAMHPDDIASIDGLLFFRATHDEYEWGANLPRSAQVISIMRSDGTTEGTVVLHSVRYRWRDTPDGPENRLRAALCTVPEEVFDGGFSRIPIDFTKMGDEVYFNYCDYEHGYELWKTDGTPGGTALVTDIAPTGSNHIGNEEVYSSVPHNLVVAGDLLYFSAFTPDEGVEPWVTDGTDSGTHLLKDIRSGTYFDWRCACDRAYSSYPNQLTKVGSEVFFEADDGSTSIARSLLWKSDGSEEGTINLKPTESRLTSIGKLHEHGNQLLFVGSDLLPYAEDPNQQLCKVGSELWVSDGSSHGTVPVRDISAGCASTTIGGVEPNPDFFILPDTDFAAVDDSILFWAFTPELGQEIWISDGNEVGTHLVIDFNPGPSDSDIHQLYNLDGTLAFFATDGGVYGKELYGMSTYKTVEIDIKPDSINNCVNINGHGVIPVTVYGAYDVNVLEIEPSTLLMQGLKNKVTGKSGKYLISYEDMNGDGHVDLLAKFADSDGFVEPGSNTAEVSAFLTDGTKVRGWDQLCLVP